MFNSKKKMQAEIARLVKEQVDAAQKEAHDRLAFREAELRLEMQGKVEAEYRARFGPLPSECKRTEYSETAWQNDRFTVFRNKAGEFSVRLRPRPVGFNTWMVNIVDLYRADPDKFAGLSKHDLNELRAVLDRVIGNIA
jgi:hypothetical protein